MFIFNVYIKGANVYLNLFQMRTNVQTLQELGFVEMEDVKISQVDSGVCVVRATNLAVISNIAKV